MMETTVFLKASKCLYFLYSVHYSLYFVLQFLKGQKNKGLHVLPALTLFLIDDIFMNMK